MDAVNDFRYPTTIIIFITNLSKISPATSISKAFIILFFLYLQEYTYLNTESKTQYDYVVRCVALNTNTPTTPKTNTP